MGGGRGIAALTVVEVAVQQDGMMMKGNKQVGGGEIILLLHTHITIEGRNIRHPQEDEEEGVALEVIVEEVDPIIAVVVVLTCRKEVVGEGRGGGVAMMIWMGVVVVVVGKMDANIDETEEEAQEVEVV